MTERIVDRLEAIEVHQEQRGRAVRPRLLVQRLFQRQLHPLAVGEPGQPVEQREPGDLGLRLALLGQVGARADEPLEPAEFVDHRPARDRPAARARRDRSRRRPNNRRKLVRDDKWKASVRSVPGVVLSIRNRSVSSAPAAIPPVAAISSADHLRRQIGDAAVAVGLPEPAGPLPLEFGHHLGGEAALDSPPPRAPAPGADRRRPSRSSADRHAAAGTAARPAARDQRSPIPTTSSDDQPGAEPQHRGADGQGGDRDHHQRPLPVATSPACCPSPDRQIRRRTRRARAGSRPAPRSPAPSARIRLVDRPARPCPDRRSNQKIASATTDRSARQASAISAISRSVGRSPPRPPPRCRRPSTAAIATGQTTATRRSLVRCISTAASRRSSCRPRMRSIRAIRSATEGSGKGTGGGASTIAG